MFTACYLHTGSRNDSTPGLPLPPWQSLTAVSLQVARRSGLGSPVTGSDSQLVQSRQGIVLSAVDLLIPAKLVKKVKAGQFVEMSEFLPDTINSLIESVAARRVWASDINGYCHRTVIYHSFGIPLHYGVSNLTSSFSP